MPRSRRSRGTGLSRMGGCPEGTFVDLIQKNAVLKDALVQGARDLGPPILEARDPARDQGRVRNGKMKPGWLAHGLQHLRRAVGTSRPSPSTTARGTRLAIAAASTVVGRARSSISRLLCCTEIGLLGQLGVGRSGLTRLETELLPFLLWRLWLRLLLRLVEHGRHPLALLHGSLEHGTVVFIEQGAGATDLMGLEVESIVHDLLARASKIGKSRA